MKSFHVIIAVTIIVLFVGGVFYIYRKRREGYGPIKEVSKLPKGICNDMCGRFYQRCLLDNPLNARMCQDKYMGCIGECQNSFMHRGVSSTRYLNRLSDFFNNPYLRTVGLYN